MAFKLVVLIVLALFFSVFVLENIEPATIQFLGWSAEVPLALVIFGSLAAGAVMIFLLSMIRELGLHSRLRENRRDSRQLSEHIEALEEDVARHQEEAARLENQVQRLQHELAAREAEPLPAEAPSPAAVADDHDDDHDGDADDVNPWAPGAPSPRE